MLFSMKSTEIEKEYSSETITVSRAEYDEKNARIAYLESQIDVLMEALRLARHKQFGASSEKSEEAAMEQLSFLFNEAEAYVTAPKEEDAVIVPEHKRRRKNVSIIWRARSTYLWKLCV